MNEISEYYVEFSWDIIKKAKDKFIYSIYNENTKLTLKNEIESLINKIKNKHC